MKTFGLTDPLTGKTYVFDGLVPASRISIECANGKHECQSAPSILVQALGFTEAKAVCCLCSCHF